MKACGLPVHSTTIISIVVKCLCQMHHTREGFVVLGYGYRRAVEPPDVIVVLSTLLDGFILEDRFLEAMTFFKKLVKQDVYEPSALLYTNIIKGLCKFRLNREAIDLLNLMGETYYNTKTNAVAYGTIINSLCKDGEYIDEALKLFREMVFHKGMKPDVVTYTSLLYGLCKLSRLDDISDLFIELEGNGCLNLEISNIFVHVYYKLNRMEDAELVVKLMLYPGFDTYKALIDAYCLLGEVSKAMQYFNVLRSRGMKANVDTYNTLLKGHFNHLYIEEAEAKANRLFHDMSKQGVEPNLTTYHIVLQKLFQVGGWSRGRKLFDDMLAMSHSQHYLRPNEITYKIVLEGLCDNNELEEALSLFHLMQVGNNKELNSENNIDLYNILIDSAINSGKLDTARNLFNDLTVKRLQPNGETYTLMIIGFCMEGLVEEAKQLFFEMIQQLDVAVAEKLIREIKLRKRFCTNLIKL